jgi:integrase
LSINAKLSLFLLIWSKYGVKYKKPLKEGFSMQAKLTQTFVQNIKPADKLFWVRDILLKGFVISVSYGGKKTYCVDYRQDGKRATYKIGDVNLYTVAEAREIARNFLASVERGEDPTAEPEPEKKITLGTFLKDHYESWVLEYRKSGNLTLAMIKANFEHLFEMPLENISVDVIEQWRTKKKNDNGVKSSSLNRMVTSLKSAINWGVKRGIIENNPLTKLEPLSERDSVKKVRYLTPEERARLMNALDEREKEIRRKRENHNAWSIERKYDTLPSISENNFADHLKPIVILALSTGIRRSSLLSLEWGDVNFTERMVMVRAATDKSEKEYYVSLNKLAFETLSRWHGQSRRTSPHDLVFPSPKTGEKLDNCNSSWEALLKRAGIEKFRWHDMRHDFASQLVMKGVDLNTVRELMGHSDMKMTLRYAHLAPENKMKAVELLDNDDS